MGNDTAHHLFQMPVLLAKLLKLMVRTLTCFFACSDLCSGVFVSMGIARKGPGSLKVFPLVGFKDL